MERHSQQGETPALIYPPSLVSDKSWQTASKHRAKPPLSTCRTRVRHSETPPVLQLRFVISRVPIADNQVLFHLVKYLIHRLEHSFFFPSSSPYLQRIPPAYLCPSRKYSVQSIGSLFERDLGQSLYYFLGEHGSTTAHMCGLLRRMSRVYNLGVTPCANRKQANISRYSFSTEVFQQ